MNKYVCTRWAFDMSGWAPTFAQLTQAMAAIQSEEQNRLMKFVFIEDCLSSLVGRLLMRKYVSACTGLDYHEIQFARDVRGKPYWVGDDVTSHAGLPTFSFNVSHQGDVVLLAGVCAPPEVTACDFGVGVDVMKIEYSGGRPLSDFFRLMNKKFSDTEWQYIMRPAHSKELDKLKAFMRHWCLKEAYVKELGVGITIDLQKLSFNVDSNVELLPNTEPITSTTLSRNGTIQRNWHFEEHWLRPQYCAAIAFRNIMPVPEKFKFLQIDELLVPSKKTENPTIRDLCEQILIKQRKL